MEYEKDCIYHTYTRAKIRDEKIQGSNMELEIKRHGFVVQLLV